MKTDLPLKRLFQLRPQDLLRLTGDQGATVRSVGVTELQEVERRPDCVWELEREGQVYLRHLEFQEDDRTEVPRRCFQYNTMLYLQTGLPALTTVLYLSPPGPRGESIYRIEVGNRVVTQFRFEQVLLWEQEAVEAMESGGPGVMPLVPLMRGADLGLVGEAAQGIEREAPEDQQADLLATLHVLAEQRYTESELTRLIGRERIMQSVIWQEAEAKGRAEGRVEGLAEGRDAGRAEGRDEGRNEGREAGLAEGQLKAEREMCHRMVERYHPRLLDQAIPAIRACTDLERLQSWIVEAPALSDEDFSRLLSDTDDS